MCHSLLLLLLLLLVLENNQRLKIKFRYMYKPQLSDIIKTTPHDTKRQRGPASLP